MDLKPFKGELDAEPSAALKSFDGALDGEAASKPSFLRRLGDLGLAGVSGVMGATAGTAGELYGLATGDMDNAALNGSQIAQDWLHAHQSESLQTDKRARSDVIDAADGILGKAGAAIAETVSNPALLADTVAENAATLIPAAGAARVVKGATFARAAARGLAAAEAEQAAIRAGTRAAIGTAAGQQAADVSTAQYQQALQDGNFDGNPDFQARVAAGEDPNQVKHDMALASARAAFLPAAAISVGSQFLPGGATVERVLAGGGGKAAGTLFSRAVGAARGALGEGVQEVVEEGGGQFAGNVAERAFVDPNADLTAGVGENAGLGFVGGAALGGGAGMVHGHGDEHAPAAAEQKGPFLALPAPNSTMQVTPEGDALTPVDQRIQRRELAREGLRLRNAGLTADVRAAQQQHPGFTRELPANSPLTKAVMMAADSGVLDSPTEQAVAFAKSEAIDKPAHVATDVVPAGMDRTSGAVPAPADDEIKDHIWQMLESGNPPNNRTVGAAFGITPKRAKALRAEVQADRRAAALSQKQQQERSDESTQRAAVESGGEHRGDVPGESVPAAAAPAASQPGATDRAAAAPETAAGKVEATAARPAAEPTPATHEAPQAALAFPSNSPDQGGEAAASAAPTTAAPVPAAPTVSATSRTSPKSNEVSTEISASAQPTGVASQELSTDAASSVETAPPGDAGQTSRSSSSAQEPASPVARPNSLPRVVRKADGVRALRQEAGMTAAEAGAAWDSSDRGGLKEGTRLGKTVRALVDAHLEKVKSAFPVGATVTGKDGKQARTGVVRQVTDVAGKKPSRFVEWTDGQKGAKFSAMFVHELSAHDTPPPAGEQATTKESNDGTSNPLRQASDGAGELRQEGDQPAETNAAVAETNGANSEPAPAQAEPKRPAGETGRIEDFGETLHGARKHYAAAYADRMTQAEEVDVTKEPLSKSWPAPDYDKLLEGGADPFVVAWVHAARDEIPARPKKSWRLKGWADAVQSLRSMANSLLSGKTDKARLIETLSHKDFRAVREHIGGRAELYEAVGHGVDLKGVTLAEHHYALYKGENNVRMWTVEKPAKATAFSNWPTELGAGKTKEEAIAAFKARLAQDAGADKQKAEKANPKHFIIYSRRGQDGFIIGRKVGRETIDLKRFPDVAAARTFKTDNFAELEKLWAKFKHVPPERRAHNLPRIGNDHRAGADVGPEQFSETFGFRGVQFGNYVEGPRRQQDLNNAYDALMDMAGVLGVPAKALSLNGSLGLAFGARGTGGKHAAAAHFEPGNIVINLTKHGGPGSLGHEWFHGLDNYFSRQRGVKLGMQTEAQGAAPGVRDEMRRAFQRVVNAIETSGIKQRSQELDKRRSKAYWATGPEMAARSFESYLINKLADQNGSNDYLANIVPEASFGLEGGYPYPTAGEIPAIRAAFDDFFNTIESDVGEGGHVRLYSRAVPGQAVRFVPDESLVKRMGRFVDEAQAGQVRGHDTMQLGPTPDVLVELGAPNIAMEVEGDAALKLLSGKHSGLGISADQLKSLPQQLADPLAVFESKVRPGALVAVTNLVDNVGRGVIVAVHLNKRSGRTVVNRIQSVHARNDGELVEWAKQGLLRYYNDETLAAPTTGAQRHVDLGKVVQAAGGLVGASVDTRTAMRNRAPKFSRGSGRGGSLTSAEVLRAIAPVREALGSNAPKVRVVEFPEQAGAQDGDEGYSEGDQVVLIASAMRSPEHARQVLVHEVVGHHGIEAITGPALWQDLTETVQKMRAGGKHAELFAELDRRYPKAEPGAYAKEAIAVMAEKGVRNSIIDRVLAALRRFLRGLAPQFLREAELRQHIVAAARYVSQDGAARVALAQPTLAFSRADPGAKPGIDPESMFGRVSNYADKIGAGRPQSVPERFDDLQRAAAEKFSTFKAGDSMSTRIERLKHKAGDRFVQKVVDQFRPLLALNREAFMQAHLSKGTDGALEAVFEHGAPVVKEGAYFIDERSGGFKQVLADLGGEHDQFLMWVVGNRAESLKGEGREHLFTDDDIRGMKRLNLGKMEDGRSRQVAYGKALSELSRYNRAFLDIAQAAGLINSESRKHWEDEFYIPFYRAMDDDPQAGPGQVKGLVRQRIIERLVGGKEPLGDPLENILANWSQILTASMKNRAANSALDAAVKLKVARRVPEAQKGAVWAMRQGEETYFVVEDSAVLEALESLNFNGYDNPVMRAAGKFKRILTTGVTINPSFRIRNMARDVLSSLATAEVGYNPMRNLVEGLRATAKGTDTNVALTAGGGAIRFGAINDGDQASHAKRLIAMGIKDNQILDSADKLKNALRRFYDWWQEVGDRTETVNRAVIYERAIKAGKTHLEASYEARDLMNFTSMGSAAAIRALCQVMPFFNARVQGVDRLVRGATGNPQRFAAVAGAIAMASALLYLINADDDDYKALPDYVRDNYWPIKLGGKWLYLPKPFEIGAMGSIVERGTELAVAGDDYQAKDFAQTIASVLTSQLAMNPIPQIVRPAAEAAFNYDMFRMAPIDSMGQQHLLPEDRFTARTSAGAVLAGRVAGISPQRLEHLVTGYFGWLGLQSLNASDYLLRDAAGLSANPAHDLSRTSNAFILGDFLKETNPGSSKYLTRFYDAQSEIDELYASANLARRTGDPERDAELRGDPKLRLRQLYRSGDKALTRINKRIKAVSNDHALSAGEKSERIDSLNRQRAVIAARIDRLAREREQEEPSP